jgi:uncharacterized protein
MPGRIVARPQLKSADAIEPTEHDPRLRATGKFLCRFLAWDEFLPQPVAAMSDAKPPQEPSMEEIIASISRSIAEDGVAREPVLPAVAEKDDVLELTEAVDEDGRVRRIEPAGPAGGPLADISSAAAAIRARLSQPDPSRADAEKPGKNPEPGRDPVLSAASAEAAAVAFARLGALPRGRPTEGELPIGDASRTLEDIVRDALLPLLRSWLDEHLPALVERLVREEIVRVAGKAGLR